MVYIFIYHVKKRFIKQTGTEFISMNQKFNPTMKIIKMYTFYCIFVKII